MAKKKTDPIITDLRRKLKELDADLTLTLTECGRKRQKLKISEGACEKVELENECLKETRAKVRQHLSRLHTSLASADNLLSVFARIKSPAQDVGCTYCGAGQDKAEPLSDEIQIMNVVSCSLRSICVGLLEAKQEGE